MINTLHIESNKRSVFILFTVYLNTAKGCLLTAVCNLQKELTPPSIQVWSWPALFLTALITKNTVL